MITHSYLEACALFIHRRPLGGVTKSKQFFSEIGHVEYQIKGKYV